MADQKYCRNCGEPNLPNAAYCANCGATVVSAAASPPRGAPSAAPSPPTRQPPYTPPPTPPPRSRSIFGLSRKMIVVGLVVVVLLLTLGCVALMATTTTTNPTATPAATTPPQATATKTTPTETPTATPAPTATPTLSSFYGLLVEHPASVSGDDQSGKINDERTSVHNLGPEPFHRATIDGRDVYIGTIVSDSGQTQKIYLFPLGSYDEARAAQAAYVKQFEAKGFTKVDEQTSNVNERSFISLQYPTTSGTIDVDALSPLYYNVGYTMSVSIPQATS